MEGKILQKEASLLHSFIPALLLFLFLGHLVAYFFELCAIVCFVVLKVIRAPVNEIVMFH